MSDWNPSLYTRFEDERTRPARDLLARVPLQPTEVRHAVDLGCGPGNSTELLANAFPHAQLVGTDNSEAMLVSARERFARRANATDRTAFEFQLSDIATWQPAAGARPDLIYANASLQWLGQHETLLPRLFDALAPGGVLAIQMPDNREESTHRLMREVAGTEPYSHHISNAATVRTKILRLQDYYDLLAPLTVSDNGSGLIDLWRTAYQHPMDDAASIVEWVKGTGLRPFLDALPDDLRAGFLHEYQNQIDHAYPPRGDGRRLLAYPRLFIVARKPRTT